MKAARTTAHTLFGVLFLAVTGVSTPFAQNGEATSAPLAAANIATSAPATTSLETSTTAVSQATSATPSTTSTVASVAVTSPTLPASELTTTSALSTGSLVQAASTPPDDDDTTVIVSDYKPLPLPPVLQDPPELEKQVSEGKLPPLKQRLPDTPAVIQPLHQVGKYGGSMRKLATNVGDLQMNHRLGYEPLVRWGRDGVSLEPGVAERWEMRDGGRTFVFHLRKGMKWSDGHPFTSADFDFTFKHILTYDGFGMLALPWIRANNKLPTIETPDPHTVIYKFEVPYGNFVRGIAASGLQQFLFGPKHYLEKHHEALIPKDKMDKMVRDAGFVTWVDYFTQRTDLSRNPELPTISPWKIVVPPPASRCVAERNPYYWKVDTAGNQLPYIDKIVTEMVFDRVVFNLKVLNGEVDFQMRNIDAGNFTLFKERGSQLGYKTLVTASTNPTCVYVNQYSRNDTLRPILQDPRFRKALSHAINREELVELIYSGLATPSSGISMPLDEFFLPGVDKANTEYNPELANKLLDEMGFKRRKADGLRTLPDGTLFSAVLHIYPSEEGSNADLWQLVVDYWREVGLLFAPKQEDQNLAFLQVTAGNADFFCYSSAALHWAVDGVWKVPISKMSYMAPLYGNYYATDGKEGIAPSAEMKQLIDWYEGLRATPDEAERMEYGRNIIRQWAEKCYVVGICQSPVVAIVSDRLRNVPGEINYDYRLKSPGHLQLEQFYFDDAGGAKP